MNIKNYTTEVSAVRSIGEIELILSQFGASAIMKEFLSDGKCSSLSFKLNGKSYKIPINQEGVMKVLYKNNRRSPRVNEMRSREERAYNVSWRVIKDWVHSQLSIVFLGQAQPDEVLLPYMFDGKRTFYQAYKDGRIQIEKKDDD